MAYITKQQLIDIYSENELIQLTDVDQLGVINDTILTQAMTDADARIDDKLRLKYPLPLLSVPATLIRIAGDISRYFLYQDNATDEVLRRYQESEALLNDYATGKAALPPDVIDTSLTSTTTATPNTRTLVLTDTQMDLIL